MLKINLEKDILELEGNDMDHINELMVIGWKVANGFPDLKEEIKKRFEATLDAKECPKLQSEKDFTNEMRELLGATNEEEEPIPLDLEDAEYLLRKVIAVRNTGKEVSFDYYGNGNVAVWIWRKDSKEKRYIDKSFDFYLYEKGRVAETSREVYNECIKYLEQLAGEEDDN
jgi:hypothetical protein|nr:MAG TPA: hypothetical protein [Caudoviricetes sp.]